MLYVYELNLYIMRIFRHINCKLYSSVGCFELNSERIPALCGGGSENKKIFSLTVGDSLQLVAGRFNFIILTSRMVIPINVYL